MVDQHNQGDLFLVGVNLIPVVALDDSEKDIEYLIVTKFAGINLSNDLLKQGIEKLFPQTEVLVKSGVFEVTMVGGKIEDERKYLQDLSVRLIDIFASFPGWGTDNPHDGDFTDQYHKFD